MKEDLRKDLYRIWALRKNLHKMGGNWEIVHRIKTFETIFYGKEDLLKTLYKKYYSRRFSLQEKEKGLYGFLWN